MAQATTSLVACSPSPSRGRARKVELASRRFRVSAGVLLGLLMLSQWAGLLGVPWVIVFLLAPIFYIWVGEVMQRAYVALFIPEEPQQSHEAGPAPP